MGCDNSSDNVEVAGAAGGMSKRPLRIYGDDFSADTRALLAVCKYANITHQYTLVDTLAKQNLEDPYIT